MPSQKEPTAKFVPTLPPIVRKSMRSGLITLGAVSENERPETSVTESLNFHFDAIGSATLRKGITRIGSQLSGNILGLYYYVDTVNASPKTQLIVANGTNLYYLSGNSFVSIRSGLTAGKTRFSTLLNYVFAVNGTDATAIWDGNTGGAFATTGNALNAPIGKFIENFRGRMWIMGNSTYPSRLYYSSIPSSATTLVITWDTDPVTGVQYSDISPQDGDFPTGLQRYRNVMLVFKTNRLYRVFSSGSGDVDPYCAVGTSSQESVVETKAGVFFHHSSGFYQYNIYGQVQEISRPIWDIIKAIPASAYTDVAGWLEPDGDHLCWSVGTITVRGTTYTNLVVRYSISTQCWTHYSYPTQFLTSIRRQPFYTDGTTQFALCGDNAGNVYEMNTGLTDDGTPIYYSLIHRWDNLDGILSTRKVAMTGNFSHIGGAMSNVNWQNEDNDPDSLNDWTKSIGQLKTVNTGFNTMDIKGRKIRIRISGQSAGQPFFYDGYELIGAQHEFIQFTT
jgi:hypothetical protein